MLHEDPGGGCLVFRVQAEGRVRAVVAGDEAPAVGSRHASMYRRAVRGDALVVAGLQRRLDVDRALEVHASPELAGQMGDVVQLRLIELQDVDPGLDPVRDDVADEPA